MTQDEKPTTSADERKPKMGGRFIPMTREHLYELRRVARERRAARDAKKEGSNA